MYISVFPAKSLSISNKHPSTTPRKWKIEKKWVSEWGNFLLNFHGQYVRVHKNKTTTSMHILIKGPPFSGPDQQILLPPLGGVWPRPGSGILVYLPPGLGHPRTPPLPPPHTKMSDPIPLTSLIFSFIWPLLYTLYIRDFSYSEDFVFLTLHMALSHIHTFIVYAQSVVFPNPSPNLYPSLT